MSHADANWRNTDYLSRGTLRFDPGRDVVNAVPGGPTYPPFLDLACGVTLEADLLDTGIRSFFRTPSVIANQAYYARECRLPLGPPDHAPPFPVIVTVTSSEFHPFVTVSRRLGQQWSSSNGVVSFTVTDDNEGPFVVEVTSLDTYATGHFTISVRCNDAVIQSSVMIAYQYFDHATQLAMSQSDFQTAYANLVAAINAYDMTTLPAYTETTFKFDGASFTQITQLTDQWPPYNTLFGAFQIYTVFVDALGTPTFAGNEYYMWVMRITESMVDPQTIGFLIPPFTVTARRRQWYNVMTPLVGLDPGFGSDPLGFQTFGGLVGFDGPIQAELGFYTTSDNNLDLQLPDPGLAEPTFALARSGGGAEIPPTGPSDAIELTLT